jgi:hypothetical protein
MRRDHVRYAVAERDDGLRRITKVTWRAGAAGVVCSALMVVAFGHHAAVAQSSTRPSTTSPAHGGASGSIQVPSQPPASSQGTGQVTSGAS